MLKSSRILAAAGAVAGLGLAAAPLNVFATRATDPSDTHTDKLVLTVPVACSFGSYTKTTGGLFGVDHDDSTSGYGAVAGQGGATTWDRDATAETSPWGNHPNEETNHNNSDVESTGDGIVTGEGRVDGSTYTANASYHTVHRTMLAGTTTETFAQTKLTVICNDAGGYTLTATPEALSNGAGTPVTIPVNNTYNATVSGYDLRSISSTNNSATTTARYSTASEGEISYYEGLPAEAGDDITVTYGIGVAANQAADTYVGTVVYKLYRGVNNHS